MKDLPEKVDSTPSNLGPDQLLTPEHTRLVTSEAALFSQGLWIPLQGRALYLHKALKDQTCLQVLLTPAHQEEEGILPGQACYFLFKCLAA